MTKRSKLAVLMVVLALVSVLSSPPAQSFAVGNFCGAALCWTESQCWDNCSSATAVACVNNLCQYTFGSGGPGGGQICPEQRICGDDSHCNYGAVQGTCVNNVCVC
jgi:hypothetical protein